MSDFDPIRALREEVSGLAEIHKVIAVGVREAEGELAAAEARHNSLIKLDAFLVGLLKEYRARLKALEDAAAQ